MYIVYKQNNCILAKIPKPSNNFIFVEHDSRYILYIYVHLGKQILRKYYILFENKQYTEVWEDGEVG